MGFPREALDKSVTFSQSLSKDNPYKPTFSRLSRFTLRQAQQERRSYEFP